VLESPDYPVVRGNVFGFKLQDEPIQDEGMLTGDLATNSAYINQKAQLEYLVNAHPLSLMKIYQDHIIVRTYEKATS
jgi:hypothetical protein